eukprot:gnl/TRDRNA2_/TRDRNA2_212476_c0_seq1.p1 gnl/TRDRNA2_/TRDRNA2_212476_c0~~gnl/TRDRNA2_/TRDRNA2_212476_c0_seq1.p1  ORF type:complete len:100 (+),score=6.89 gnl/TRDRNA2_/TRDRNA2_212476_c0_seq1:118-417(+)
MAARFLSELTETSRQHVQTSRLPPGNVFFFDDKIVKWMGRRSSSANFCIKGLIHRTLYDIEWHQAFEIQRVVCAQHTNVQHGISRAVSRPAWHLRRLPL